MNAASTTGSSPLGGRATHVAVLVLAALLACLALALRPAPASALQAGFLDPGFQVEQPDVFWGDMKALRGRVVRYDVYWRDVAPQRPAAPRDPASPAYSFTLLDGLVSDAAAHNADVILTIWRTPTWARANKSAGGSSYAFAPNLRDFGDFVHAIATRYSGKFDPDGAGPLGVLPKVKNWEMWNEPNYIGALRPQKSGNRAVSPAIYAGILNKGYAEVKKVDKTMKVLGGAMNRGFGGKGSVAALVFLRGMKKANAKFDIATVHPYPPTGVEGLDDGTTAPNITLINFKEYEKELDKLYKPKKYDIWLTEFGAQSEPDANGASLPDQALFVKQAIKRIKNKHPRVKRVIWFLLRDEPLEQPGQSDRWQSGLRDENGAKKPAYNAWLSIKSLLS